MNNLVKINNQDLQVKEFDGQRVVTFKDIDMLHERVEGTAKRNFNENKHESDGVTERFIKGIDYFIITPSQKDEIRTLEIPNRGITLITESGYLMLVKSLTDDLAWKVQRELVNNYFRVKSIANAQKTINEFKGQITTFVSDLFQNKIGELEQYYKIKVQSKVDISTYIKKRLGILRADDEYEQVKARIFLLLGITKWEDLDIDSYKSILPIVDESIRVIKMDRPQQASMWD